MGTSFSTLGRLRRITPTGRPNNGASHPTEENIHDRHPEPASVMHYHRPTLKLFALIIGINTYGDCTRLRGAVDDAIEMKRYLQEILGVSEEYIHILLDSQATRSAIIDGFRGLRDDRRIRKGDPILIFFAGHGTELRAPRSWRINGMIQGLLPHDYSERKGRFPIPDHTVGALIEDIARAKGNNITVIFDCCYAAGGTRTDDKEYIPRRAEHIDPNILLNVDDLDQDIVRGRDGEMSAGFGTHGVESHVLLAACRKKELAYEYKGRGLFTSELLRILRGGNINRLTYAGVTESISLDRQHPSCQGVHDQRVLFNMRVTGVTYLTRVDGNNLVIHAGKAHGVSHGVQFTLYDERGRRLDVTEVDKNAKIQDFKTIIRKHPFRNPSFAKLTRVGKVSIYVNPERNHSHRSLEKDLRRLCQGDDANFQLVKDRKEARLEVMVESGCVSFEILDEQTRRFGLKRLPYTTIPRAVHHVLSAAAHYYWYLRYTNSGVNTSRKVDVNFYELGWENDEDMMSHRVPVGQGLCRKDPKDNSDIISFEVAHKKSYGIEIKNNTRRDLYVNAFLFNSSSLKIAPYRIQSIVGNPEAPLKQNGMMTIGYGDSGDPPFEYWVGKGQNIDVGYLKLVFATQPIDLSGIIQGSPFQPDTEQSQCRPLGDAREGDAETQEKGLQDMWFTKVIPIVQRRNTRRERV